MGDERVLSERDGAVMRVTMNRPDKRNGLDRALIVGLVEAGEAVMADRSVRAVVLAGAGPAFCAGLDFKSFMAGGPAEREALLARPGDGLTNIAQRCAWIWQEVEVPVIAALHGVAFGGGLQIALGADLRYAAPGTELSIMEMRWGLVPDMALTQTARGLVRADVLKELTFTGRRVDAHEAQALGLVTKVMDDPHAAALALAHEIARQSPDAVRRAKRLLNDAAALGRAEAFALETRLQLELLGSRNQIEAVRANFTGTAPNFKD